MGGASCVTSGGYITVDAGCAPLEGIVLIFTRAKGVPAASGKAGGGVSRVAGATIDKYGRGSC